MLFESMKSTHFSQECISIPKYHVKPTIALDDIFLVFFLIGVLTAGAGFGFKLAMQTELGISNYQGKNAKDIRRAHLAVFVRAAFFILGPFIMFEPYAGFVFPSAIASLGKLQQGNAHQFIMRLVVCHTGKRRRIPRHAQNHWPSPYFW